MAEIVNNEPMGVVRSSEHIPSNSKANAGLVLGIIGSALGGLSLLGNGVMCSKYANGWNNGCGNWGSNYGNGWNGINAWNGVALGEAMYSERKECKDCLDLTREHYQGRLKSQADLATAFFDTWKRDADNSFGLYKSQRDGFDITNEKLNEAAFGLYKSQRDGFDITNEKMNEAAFGLYKSQRDGFDITNEKMNKAAFDLYKNQRDGFDIMNQKMIDSSFNLYKNQRDGFDIMNQKMIDSSFNLYKNQRDTKDEINGSIGKTNQRLTDVAFELYKNERDNKDILEHKINALQNKVDVLTAVRPYQDALINAKIDKNEILSDFKLAKRTSRMIEGRIVLPNEEISGFPGYNFSVTA